MIIKEITLHQRPNDEKASNYMSPYDLQQKAKTFTVACYPIFIENCKSEVKIKARWFWKA